MATENRLTKRVLQSLQPRSKDYFVWDASLPSYGVRVWPSGRIVYLVQYREGSRIRRYKIGTFPQITPDQARRTARSVLGRVERGESPAADRDETRQGNTFREFAETYMDRAKSHLGERTWWERRRQLDHHILPLLGSKRLDQITRDDIERLKRKVAEKREKAFTDPETRKRYKRTLGGAVHANRCLALTKVIFNEAERSRAVPEGHPNPCRHVQLFRERPRQRYLTADELKRLGRAIEEAATSGEASSHAIGAIRLLLFTGARRSEILTLKWEYVDAENRCLRLPESKTGPKVIYLNAPAAEVITELAGIREEGNPYVIVGHRPGAHMVNLTKPWHRIRQRAELPDLRLHDLRHVFGGSAAALGLGLPIVGELLGHRQPSTTARYANLAPNPVAQANEQVGAALAEALEGARAEVVDMNAGQAPNPEKDTESS